MSATNIAIGIATEYKGQGVTKAKSDLASLGGEAKKLAGYFGASLGTAAVVSFGVAAVKAFAADNVSAKILSNTLDNLGLAFADIPIEKFITNMSEANGIAKSDLRTSFDTLVRATGSATKSQDLLNLSLNVSSGTGKNLALVSGAIAKAYGGNVVALSRLGAGLSKVDLKTKSFVQLQAELNGLFTGDARTAADSYAGSVNRIKTAWEEAKITIGGGIVDALTNVGSSAGLSTFVDGMNTVATDVANTLSGLGLMVGAVVKVGKGLSKFTLVNPFHVISLWAKDTGVLGLAMKLGADKAAKVVAVATKAALTNSYHDSISAVNSLAAANAKVVANAKVAAAAALAAANKLKQAALDKLKAEREALSLKLAGSTVDMQNIEIQAALQRGQTTQVNDVLLLQRAILNGNADQADILAQKVLRSNGLVMDVNGNISNLATAKDPFKDWPPASANAIAQIAAIQLALAQLVAKPYVVQIQQVVTTSSGNSLPGVTPGPLSPNSPSNTWQPPSSPSPSSVSAGLLGTAAGAAYMGSSVTTNNPQAWSMPSQNLIGNLNSSYMTPPPVTVNVTLNGAAVANAVQQTIVDNTASGTSSTYTRSLMGVW